jgi:hypothetical protein
MDAVQSFWGAIRLSAVTGAPTNHKHAACPAATGFSCCAFALPWEEPQIPAADHRAEAIRKPGNLQVSSANSGDS